MSTHFLSDATEDETRKGAIVSLLAEGKELACNPFFVYLFLDAVIECLPKAWHANEDGYLASAECVHDVRSREAGADGYATTLEDRSYGCAHEGQDMVEGQEYHSATRGIEDRHLV